MVPERKRLSAADWVVAALAALADGGLAGVAVEPLATRLGATKGSFYWHFACRDALLDATLRHWEQTRTEAVIAAMDAEPDPRSRLHRLITFAIDSGAESGGGARVELALQASATHPLVAPTVDRITRRRLGYLGDQFVALGFNRAEGHRRSVLAYSSYLGLAQLRHATPDLVPAPADVPAYVESVTSVLTAGTAHQR